jgi:hypothetical protein
MIPQTKIRMARGFTTDIANLLSQPNTIVVMTIATLNGPSLFRFSCP